MKIIPLFGSGIQSYSAVTTSQRRLNCFYDLREDGDAAKMVLRGTPGSVLWITLPVNPIRGWHVVGNLMYVVASKNLYSVTTSGTATFLGTIGTSAGRVEIADNGLQLCIVDGTSGYYFTILGSTLGQIVDGNFPNGAQTVAFLNGRFIVEKFGTRQFYVSQIYDATNWTPAAFASKENESSNLLAVDVANGTLNLWGLSGIEFWQDVAASPQPYQRVAGTSQSWGLAAIASRALFNNTEIFLGQNPQGHLQVLALQSYVPTRVSTTDIENIIAGFSTFSDAVALTYIIDGHPIYQLTFPTAKRTLCYDGLTGIWHEAQTGLAAIAPHFGLYGIVFNSQNYICDSTTGNIYQLSPTAYTDNGVSIKRQCRSIHVQNGGNIFAISEIYLVFETGIGLQGGQGSDPTMLIAVSKDGGRTFGIERHVDMGAAGQYRNPRVIARRWGQARDFVWQFTVTDPVPFTLVSGAAVIAGQEGAFG